MTPMHSRLLLLLMPVLALGQSTTLSKSQIKYLPLPTPALRLILPSGEVRYAAIGSGLVINTANNPWTIEAVGQQPITLVSFRLTPITTPTFAHARTWTQPGHWPLPLSGT